MFKDINPYNKAVITFIMVIGLILAILFLIDRLTEPKLELQLQQGTIKVEGTPNIKKFLDTLDNINNLRQTEN